MVQFRPLLILVVLLVVGTLCGLTASVVGQTGPASATRSETDPASSSSNTRTMINGCEVNYDPPQKANGRPVAIYEHHLLEPNTDKTWRWNVDNAQFRSFQVILRVENLEDLPVITHNLKWSLKGGQCISRGGSTSSNGVSVTTNAGGVVLDFHGRDVRSVGAWTLTLKSAAAVAFYDVDIQVSY